MITFYCTKKLEKFIRKPLMADPQLDVSLEGWNANLFYVNRKRYIIAMLDQTCYAILISNILKKDLKNISTLFADRLKEQLDFDGIPLFAAFLTAMKASPQVQFIPTNGNRRIIGTMTQFIKDLDWWDFDETRIREAKRKLTDNLVTALSDKPHEYKRPMDLMYRYLAEGRCIY